MFILENADCLKYVTRHNWRHVYFYWKLELIVGYTLAILHRHCPNCKAFKTIAIKFIVSLISHFTLSNRPICHFKCFHSHEYSWASDRMNWDNKNKLDPKEFIRQNNIYVKIRMNIFIRKREKYTIGLFLKKDRKNNEKELFFRCEPIFRQFMPKIYLNDRISVCLSSDFRTVWFQFFRINLRRLNVTCTHKTTRLRDKLYDAVYERWRKNRCEKKPVEKISLFHHCITQIAISFNFDN